MANAVRRAVTGAMRGIKPPGPATRQVQTPTVRSQTRRQTPCKRALTLGTTLAGTATAFGFLQQSAKEKESLPTAQEAVHNQSKPLAIVATVPVATVTSSTTTWAQLGRVSKAPSVFINGLRGACQEAGATFVARIAPYTALFTASDAVDHPVGSVAAGASASTVVATPFEHVRTLLQNNPASTPTKVCHALMDHPGKIGTGLLPTSAREICVTAGVLATDQLGAYKTPATFALAAVTGPVDEVRARMQAQPVSDTPRRVLLREAVGAVGTAIKRSPRTALGITALRGVGVTTNIEAFKFVHRCILGATGPAPAAAA